MLGFGHYGDGKPLLMWSLRLHFSNRHLFTNPSSTFYLVGYFFYIYLHMYFLSLHLAVKNTFSFKQNFRIFKRKKIAAQEKMPFE
jgi:hypothetical protein